jgi:Heat shock protein
MVAVLLVVVALAALVGCSREGGSPDGGVLDGTRWRLTEWTLSSLDPADFTITARFADGQISGNSGVNSYSGTYQAGSGDAFSLGQIAVTEMGGQEPAMRAEAAYLTLLSQAKSFKLTGGRLTLYDQGRNESLLFEAAGT